MSEIIENAIKLLVAGGAFAFIEFLIRRRDDKKDKKDGLQAALGSIKTELESIKTDLDKRFKRAEKDGLRTQLLVMILLRPQEKKEILTLGQRYFSKPPEGLNGNWYMTDIYKKWLQEEGHSNPDWFKQ